MGWILTLFYFALILVFLPRLGFVKRSGLDSIEIRILFSLKVGAGLLLWAIYHYYYGNDRVTADAFRFFDDALIIYSVVATDPMVYLKILLGLDMSDPQVVAVVDQMNNWYKPYNQGVYNDNQSIIRFNALSMILSFGYFQVHTVLINLLSFLGMLAIYRVLKKELMLPKYLLLITVFLIPQVLLWSSGVLKEPLLFFSLGLFFFALWHIFRYRALNVLNSLAALIGLTGLLLVKNYILLCLLPSLVFLISLSVFRHWRAWQAAILSLLICLVSFFVLSSIPQIGLLDKLVSKQVNFIRLGIMSDSGSYFEIPKLSPDIWSFLSSSPEAFMNTSIRPFLWNVSSILELFSSIEALVISLIFLLTMIFANHRKMWNSDIMIFSLLFFLSLFILIGWVTPVAGAIVRYKIPALIFAVPCFVNFLIPAIREKI